MKKIICIVATVVAISGCTAHGGGLDNRTKGTILGGVAGGFVGNQFGRGSGNGRSKVALGAVMGVILDMKRFLCPRIIPKSKKSS